MTDPLTTKETFIQWLCREIPPGTIVGDPKWWATRIYDRARAASDTEWDRLTAERDRAFSTLEAYGVPRDRARNVANGIEVLATRLSRASHEPPDVQRDAERYRWLRERINWRDTVETSGELSCHYRIWEHRDYRRTYPKSETIDEAIDAARAAAAKEGGI